MRVHATAAALAVITLASLLAPALAAPLECPDEDDCGTACTCPDCALCLCCSRSPQTVLTGAVGVGDAQDDGLQSDPSAAPLEPFPRDILHVPRSAALR